MLDYDRFSRDDPIGETCVPIMDVDLVEGQTLWKNLQPCKGHTVSEMFGDLADGLEGLCEQICGGWGFLEMDDLGKISIS